MIVGMGPVKGEPVVRLAAVEQSAVKLLPLSRSRAGPVTDLPVFFWCVGPLFSGGVFFCGAVTCTNRILNPWREYEPQSEPAAPVALFRPSADAQASAAKQCVW